MVKGSIPIGSMGLLHLPTFTIKNVGKYTLGLPPTQDASHHQDFYIFSRESQPKPSFATGDSGWGVDPKYTIHGSYGIEGIY